MKTRKELKNSCLGKKTALVSRGFVFIGSEKIYYFSLLSNSSAEMLF